MSRTYVIAEAGSCHDGDINKAFMMIAAAKRAGADAVKFQYWSSPERMAERRQAPDYLDIYRAYRVPEDWLRPLKSVCDTLQIAFMCSAYLPEDVATVAPFVAMFKVSSFEANDRALLKAHEPFLGKSGKNLIVSCGMDADSHVAVKALWEAGFQSDKLWFLHCVTAYPAPLDQLNLGVLRPHHHDFAYDGPGGGDLDSSPFHGYSDHSGDERVGAWAVAAGAGFIEVHFRVDSTEGSNPDAGPHALRPEALARYISNIRQVEIALGPGNQRLMPCEQSMARYRVVS